MEFEKDGKKLNLLNEYLFPKIFGESGCENETLHLINTFTGETFTSVYYVPNEMEGLHHGNKKSNVDVLVLVNDGSLVNIESQIKPQKGFHKRSHMYNSKMYAVLVKVGDDYENAPKTYMTNLLDFNLLPTEDYHSILVLCDKKSKFMIEDIIEIHYIELPKFRKELRKGNLDLNDPLTRILLLLNKSTSSDLMEKVINMDKSVNKMYEKTLHVLQDQKEYLAYIRAEQAELDEKARIRYATDKGKEERELEIAKNF
ncbi:MAG: Rpn family recombination-promoting nuclease/putative transposase, partial [Methanobrevibacter sp.]|nr:Rpn family recombination-promoting nuclease/putative transposase [Methanobrevibacter sp.]